MPFWCKSCLFPIFLCHQENASYSEYNLYCILSSPEQYCKVKFMCRRVVCRSWWPIIETCLFILVYFCSSGALHNSIDSVGISNLQLLGTWYWLAWAWIPQFCLPSNIPVLSKIKHIFLRRDNYGKLWILQWVNDATSAHPL